MTQARLAAVTLAGSPVPLDLLALYGTYAGAGFRAVPSQTFAEEATGTNVCSNTRWGHTLAQAAASLKVCYANFWDNSGIESPAGNVVTVRAAVEYPAGTYTPLLFSGARDVTIPVSQIATSDPLALSIPVNTQFWTRTLVSVASSSLTWPLLGPQVAAEGDGVSQAGTYTDLTTSGTIALNSGPYGFAPCSVRVNVASQRSLRLLGAGDSIMAGTGDSTDAQRGWWGIAFNGQVINQRISYGSERALDFAMPSRRYRRMPLADGANVAICSYGINDLSNGSTLAAVQANLQTAWAVLRGRGLPVFQATITPHSTSTDNWATTANQTPAFFEAARVALNTWIRSVPAGLTGYLDVADVCETSRNSGLWISNGTANAYTVEGTHPTAAMHALIAAAAVNLVPALTAAVR